MFVKNHTRTFRPLLGGICVQNPIVRSVGTLGCILTSDGRDRWLVSAYHVLGREDRSDYAPGEAIHQPTSGEETEPVARMAEGRSDPRLDVAAAEVLPGVETLSEVLEVGALREVRAPVVGMRVLKSGISTGVTEGRVASVTDERFEVEINDGWPSAYQLSFVSDSGSVWIDRETHGAVGLHFGGNAGGRERASAVPFPKVLEVLDLRLVEPD